MSDPSTADGALSSAAPLASLAASLPSDGQGAGASSAPADAADAHSQSESDAPDDADAVANPLSDDESDSDDASGGGDDEVHLGFLEEALHPRAMLREHFPNKVGGKPAWLNPKHVPTVQQLTCANCKNPMLFLLQLYAPLRSTFGSHPGSFHRTLYLFCCVSDTCTNLPGSIVCLRSQLPRANPFYPPVAPPKLDEWPLEREEDQLPVWEDRAEAGTHLCSVCGCLGPSACSKCHSRRYCSRAHQLADWKEGHKAQCQNRTPEQAAEMAEQAAKSRAASSDPPSVTHSSLLFPQKELVIEGEFESDSDAEGGEKKQQGEKKTKEQQLLEAYEQQKKKEKEAGEEEEDEEEIASAASSWASPKLKDPLFLRFKSRTAAKPEQVLRYARGEGEKHTQPLWVSTWFQPASAPLPERAVDSEGRPVGPPPKPVAPSAAANQAAIPRCQSCGGERRFEVQVLPQLLFYLGDKARGLDFANLVVYTCARSCGDGVTATPQQPNAHASAYFEEYTWIQAHVPEPGLKKVANR